MADGTRNYTQTEYGLAEALAGEEGAHIGRPAILMYLAGRELCAASGPDGNDGHLTAKDTRYIAVSLDLSNEEFAEGLSELEDFGFWEQEGSGYFDRQYLVANRTAEQRATARQRRAKPQPDYRSTPPL